MSHDVYLSRTKYICITAAIGGLLFGFDTAVISGAINLVKTQFSLDTTMEGWLVSSGLAGCILGVVATGFVSDRIGRKKTIWIAALMFLFSALGCAFAKDINLLVTSRLIGGIGVGIASVISPMYIAEFAPANKRGEKISYYQLAITIGVLLAYFSNAIIISVSEKQWSIEGLQWFFSDESWRPMFLVMAIPSLIFMWMLLKIPESPRWLVTKNKSIEAKEILQSIRMPQASDKEFNDINIAATKKQTTITLLTPSLRIPLLIGIVMAVLQQLSGINAIIYYGPSIFQTAGIDNSNALLFQVIIGAVNLFFTIIAIKWIDIYGRKILLKIGLTGIIISLTLCGILFYSGQTQGYLLLVLILFYIACFAFSLGPITWVLINEIFPTAVRVKAVSICTLALWIAVWILGQFFPWLLEHAGPAVIFWLFAGCSLINFIFCWNVVKETKGKTLEEMEEVFVAPH
jgi:SP family arabinose:H+ symporter-like MFS transporter